MFWSTAVVFNSHEVDEEHEPFIYLMLLLNLHLEDSHLISIYAAAVRIVEVKEYVTEPTSAELLENVKYDPIAAISRHFGQRKPIKWTKNGVQETNANHARGNH